MQQAEEEKPALAPPSEAAPAEESDPLHIGNLVAIVSEAHGLTVGRIVYRDLTAVRIMPQEASDRAIEFRLTDDGSTFVPELGVSSIEIIEEQTSDYYVDFLGARPGEVLEFFTMDGQEAAPSGTVAEILKTPTKDAIRLEDGRIISFRGRGPRLPVAVIRVRTAANLPAQTAATEEGVDVGAAAALDRQRDIMTLLMSVLPAAQVEVVPTAERSYPDSMQREDLFQDLLKDLKEKQQTPRRIRRIEREVDLAMSLKNNALLRDEAGRVRGVAPFAFDTFGDVLAATEGQIPAAIPVIAAARVLNLDELKPEGTEDIAFKSTDVEPRTLGQVEGASVELEKLYAANALGAQHSGFAGYMYDLLGRDQITLSGPREREWISDQDVLRTAELGSAVQGLSSDLPRPDDREAPSVSLIHLVSDVIDRSVRVLSADNLFDHKTGRKTLIAPADPSKISGYVMLPAKAALALRPPRNPGDLPTALLYTAALEYDNLPTIAETLRDLYTPERGSPLNAWSATVDEAAEIKIAEWLNTVLKFAVHPADSLGPRTPRLLSLLDSLGVGSRDLSKPVADVLQGWVAQCQAQWRTLLKTKREQIKASLDAEGERVFTTVAGEDATVWSTLQGSQSLAEFFEDLRRRNPTIASAPTLITSSFYTEAQGDAGPLAWSALAARDIGIDTVSATAALAASRAYALRRKALRDIGLLSLRAEPHLSTCPHTARLEAIRGIQEPIEGARLLREFIEEYQGGRKGDWVLCALCEQPCVCFHELMQLEALAQPQRMDAIMKQMMIRFGGERYEGKIVCKNCGQPLQDIDYDAGVEFDDEGNAMTGRSVLTEEQMEGVGPEWKRELATMTAPSIEFGTQSQRELADALQVLLERGGMIAQPDAIRQIIRYADLYVSIRAPSQDAYEKQRAKMLTAATTKIRTATGAGVATVDVPTYAAVLDQLRVSALIATTAIALQVAEPQIVVNNPFPLCKFGREGWPMDPTAKPDESEPLVYVACVVASIQRDATPWRSLLWAGEPKFETRRKKALQIGMAAAQIIVAGDPKSGPLSFTPEIRSALTRAQTDVEAALKRQLVSHTDQLPAAFRPEPFPPKMGQPAVERDPLPAIESALREGGDVGGMIADVGPAVRQQSIAIAAELHAAAKAGTSPGEKKTTEGICCPTPLFEADLRGPVGQAALTKAAAALRSAIPSTPRAGTHLWPVMEEPEVVVVEQSVEPDVFFKLFLRYCYRGPQVGELHEFSAGNACRQCGLELGKPLDLVDFSAEGAGILAAQQGELRIEITAAAFDALSDAVRRRRILADGAVAVASPWISGLQSLMAIVRQNNYADLADALGTALSAIESAGDTLLDDIGRVGIWEQITMMHDMLRERIAEKIGPLVPKSGGQAAARRAAEANAALSMIDKLVEDPFIEGPRAIQEFWCAKTEATGEKYAVVDMPAKVSMTLTKSGQISREHKVRLDKILRENSEWYGGTLRDETRAVIRHIGLTLGPWIRTWIQAVRPSHSESSAWTSVEAQQLMRTLIFRVWADALSTASPFYGFIGAPAEREAVSGEVANWSRGLMMHAKHQFARYTKEQIRLVLQQRAEADRNRIVQEFEEIKDDDERAAVLAQKQMKLGRWARGANIREYDADQIEFEAQQREKMGIVEHAVGVIVPEGAGAEYNLADVEEDGYFDMDAANDD